MITLAQLGLFISQIKANTSIQSTLLVSTEAELAKKMPNLKIEDYPIAVFVIPSFDGVGANMDSFALIVQMIVFILKKDRLQGGTEMNTLADMEETLGICKDIINLLLNGFPDNQNCQIASRTIVSSIHVDPEYNYLSNNGWSIGFQVKC